MSDGKNSRSSSPEGSSATNLRSRNPEGDGGGKDLLLAIDQGTQSVRAMLFDPQGELLAKLQVHIQPYYSRPCPGWPPAGC